MNRLRLAATVVFLGTALWLHAANWDQWRGSDNSGMASGDAPINWSGAQNIKWAASIPGRASPTPIVWGDRGFLTTAIPVEADSEETGDCAGSGSAVARQSGTASGGDGVAMTPVMRERIREFARAKELSELGREQRREVMHQLRRDARDTGARRASGAGQPSVGIAEHRFVAMALDRNTGKKIWERTPIVTRGPDSLHRNGCSHDWPS